MLPEVKKSRMKIGVLVILTSLVSLTNANPNFERYAEIFGKEISVFSKIYRESGIEGYFDCEGKLWVLGDKWATDTLRRGIKTDTGWVYFWEKEKARYPHLLFSIYDTNGVKINEGSLGDSIGSPFFFMPFPDGGALIIARGCTDHPWSHHCYNKIMQVDAEGKIQCTYRTPRNSMFSSPVLQVVMNSENTVFAQLMNKMKRARISIKNDSINIEFYEFPVGGKNILEMLRNNNPFHWSPVETCIRDEKNDLKEIIFHKDRIQISYYDSRTQDKVIQKYSVPNASFRKFTGFDACSLQRKVIWRKYVQDVPEAQSVKLNDGGVVLTYFMKEKEDIVAYQMRFDSLGQLIEPCSLEVLKPDKIDGIPENSRLYIKRVPVIHRIHKKWDGQKSVDVFIWGYSREDGMLYWSKYSYEQTPET